MSSIPQIINIVTIYTQPRSQSNYATFCQLCSWYGYDKKKIIREFEGIRPEEEDDFAYKFTEYDYDTETGEKGARHIHKYDPKLVDEAVNFALKIRNDRSCGE